MANYYFLAPSLPPLRFGDKPEIAFEELNWSFLLNLSQSDREKSYVIRLYRDLGNIRALLLEEQIDPRGVMSEKELDEALLLKTGLPEYVYDFLDLYETPEERLKYFPRLISRYFQEEMAKASGFLLAYLQMERDFRLVTSALRASKMKRDILKEMQFEDFHDPLVMHILAQRDAPSYEPPTEYQELKALFLSCGEDPNQQNMTLSKWRFDQITNLEQKPLFSIDWILGYMAKLIIVEDLVRLSEERGRVIIESFKAG